MPEFPWVAKLFMACKNADWSQLGDGAEVEVDGGGGAVGGGAMSREGGI
jgi:hypothetical protein